MFTSVTVKRYAAGSWAAGVFTAGAQSTVTITASVQPAKPDELQNLSAAARRSSAGIKVYSESELRTADEATGIQADRVSWEGEDWEVQAVSRHRLSNLAHYKALATRMDRA
jgi:hypothetical protein